MVRHGARKKTASIWRRGHHCALRVCGACLLFLAIVLPHSRAPARASSRRCFRRASPIPLRRSQRLPQRRWSQRADVRQSEDAPCRPSIAV